jgi:hypothetical protein
MTSNINPQNIDGAYPVAGQDNDSQGFRDNFTNIRTNFDFAKAEITDLQNNAVLKGALTGSTLNNNMNGSILSNAQLQNIRETVVDLGTASGAIVLSYSSAPYYTLVMNGATAISFTGWPQPQATPTVVGRMRLRVTVNNIAHTLTITPTGPLPTALIGVGNVQGLDPNTGIIVFNQTGTYEFEFESSNGGASISVFDLNRNRDPIYLPSVQVLSANGNIDLNTTTTIITNTGDITGNVANGAEGQIKIIAYGGNVSGNALINFSNAAWAAGNIANVSAVGSAATFQYINGSWFCVGNNGATFN